MKIAAFTLILGVFVANFLYRHLAEGTRFSHAAMYYMLSGLWIAVLSAFLFLVFSSQRPGFWRWLGMFAMFVSVSESLQTSVCRFAVADIKAVPANVNLCDYVTGLPVGASMVALYLLIIVWRARHALK